MGADLSKDEKFMLETDYAQLYGTDESSKKCAVYRNFSTDNSTAELKSLDDPSVHSPYQYFLKQWK